MTIRPVYMDNHSTTRVDPRVAQSVLEMMVHQFGNAGSTTHRFGEAARGAVELGRQQIAAAIGAQAKEIVFTSGATESNNLALRGLADRPRRQRNHIVSATTEHRAILDPLARLSRQGIEVQLLTPIPVGHARCGWIDPQQVAEALRDDTLLVTIMVANNEIGVIQSVREIGAICRSRGVLLHCDATQAIGRMHIDVADLQIDLMSFTAHKIYGPKGIGALFVRSGPPQIRLSPFIEGGGQERGLRSGTLNVPGIVGFALALQLCVDELTTERARIRAMRDRLASGLLQIPNASVNGPALDLTDLRLAANLNLSFADVDGEALMLRMPDLAVSSGSACTSANPQPSHVLLALGLSDDLTRSSLRFGLGRFNSEAEVDYAIQVVTDAVTHLRKLRR